MRIGQFMRADVIAVGDPAMAGRVVRVARIGHEDRVDLDRCRDSRSQHDGEARAGTSKVSMSSALSE